MRHGTGFSCKLKLSRYSFFYLEVNALQYVLIVVLSIGLGFFFLELPVNLIKAILYGPDFKKMWAIGDQGSKDGYNHH